MYEDTTTIINSNAKIQTLTIIANVLLILINLDMMERKHNIYIE